MYKSAALIALFTLAVSGCENDRHTQTTKRVSLPKRQSNPESNSVAEVEAPASFELYSSLAGKMARMEELRNAIDRFLDVPDFQDRLITDAEEFHRLLIESRALYPKELSSQVHPQFDESIDQTAVTSQKLLDSLRANDHLAARVALHQLDKQRQKAHARFSN